MIRFSHHDESFLLTKIISQGYVTPKYYPVPKLCTRLIVGKEVYVTNVIHVYLDFAVHLVASNMNTMLTVYIEFFYLYGSTHTSTNDVNVPPTK